MARALMGARDKRAYDKGGSNGVDVVCAANGRESGTRVSTNVNIASLQ
jgi:hypothetical protein